MTATLHLRPATAADAELLWHWANDADVRRASFSSEPIAWDEHLAWCHARLGDSRCRLLIACDADGTPCGQIRFDCREQLAIMSVSLATEFRGRGLASDVIRQAASEQLCQSDTSAVVALIRPENMRSQRAFARAGFEFNGEQLVKGQPAVRYVLRRDDA